MDKFLLLSFHRTTRNLCSGLLTSFLFPPRFPHLLHPYWVGPPTSLKTMFLASSPSNPEMLLLPPVRIPHFHYSILPTTYPVAFRALRPLLCHISTTPSHISPGPQSAPIFTLRSASSFTKVINLVSSSNSLKTSLCDMRLQKMSTRNFFERTASTVFGY